MVGRASPRSLPIRLLTSPHDAIISNRWRSPQANFNTRCDGTATLLQLLYSIRSERQLVERIEFDLLFRWFVGLSIDEKVFDASTFSKNRDRLLTQEIAQGFLSSLLALAEVKGLLSAEHFSVDGTLLKAFASMKSFRPKDGSGEPPSPGRNG